MRAVRGLLDSLQFFHVWSLGSPNKTGEELLNEVLYRGPIGNQKLHTRSLKIQAPYHLLQLEIAWGPAGDPASEWLALCSVLFVRTTSGAWEVEKWNEI